MKRFIESNLLTWKKDPQHKPLILTGARQVGKSYVVSKNFAQHFSDCITINFERQPEFSSCFKENLNPINIVQKIEILSNKRIQPKKTLLFFDEVQNCPKALTALRYFYEEMPDLHIIAAGSLVDFTLENISFPVGRVTFRHLTPLSFEEFLFNLNENLLLEQLQHHSIDMPFSEATHQRSLSLLKTYLSLGGMPKVIDQYIQYNDLILCQETLSDLLETYQNDFPKYAKKNADLKYIDTCFKRIPHLVGQQFKYVQIARDIKSVYIKRSLELLSKASIISPIYQASKIPLQSSYNPDKYKLLFLDVGLMQRACGLNIKEWLINSYDLLNKGPIAEQFIGQQILANSFRKESLYYWQRNKKGSQAEIDYLIEAKGAVYPIEVKSGAHGKIRSMQLFLEKYPEISTGFKTSVENFYKQKKIQSIPLYAFGSFLSRIHT